MSKSIGNLSGAVLAIGLLAALSGQCEPLPAGQYKHELDEMMRNLDRLVNLRVNESTHCTGIIVTQAIVATASACIDSVRYPSLITVEPYEDGDWNARGLTVCRGKDDLSQKLSFLVLDKELTDKFIGIAVGPDQPIDELFLGTRGFVFRYQSRMPIEVSNCPSHNKTVNDLCLDIPVMHPSTLGCPVLGVLHRHMCHLAGLVYELPKKEATNSGLIEYPAMALDLLNITTQNQFLNQANECEFDTRYWPALPSDY